MAKSLDNALRPRSGRHLRDIREATWNYSGLVLAFGAVDWYQNWPHSGVILHNRIIVGWIVETDWSDTASCAAGRPSNGAVIRLGCAFIVAEKRQRRAFEAVSPDFDPEVPRGMPELLRVVYRRANDQKGRSRDQQDTIWNESMVRQLIWWFGRMRVVQKKGRGRRVWEMARRSRHAPYELVDPDLADLYVEHNDVRSFTADERATYATQSVR